MTIRQVAAERKIKFLFHFTRLENLASILTYGLMPKSLWTLIGIDALTNDSIRLDDQDAVCLTISFPNYKMFYRMRMQQSGSEWAVIGVDARVLWEKRCAFCKTNAASASVTAIPIADREGPDAFRGMFDDFGEKRRADLGLQDNMPTNPQAEILVFDTIGPEYFVGVIFNKVELKVQYVSSYGSKFNFLFNPTFFNARPDHQHWKA